MAIRDTIQKLKNRDPQTARKRFELAKPRKKIWLRPTVHRSKNAIRKTNAEKFIADDLPKPGEEMRVVCDGSFVMADMLCALIRNGGGTDAPCYFCSLGMSEKNDAKSASIPEAT